jgi:hypothetical protein
MHQATLFEKGDAPAPAVEWIAWGVRPDRHYQLVRHGKPTSIYVHKAPHPTALWPYFITRDAAGNGPMTLAPNRRGFQLLADAQAKALTLE